MLVTWHVLYGQHLVLEVHSVGWGLPGDAHSLSASKPKQKIGKKRIEYIMQQEFNV